MNPALTHLSIALPSMVKIACYDIRIEIWNPAAADSARRFAEFSSIEQLIRVDSSKGKWKAMDSLLHEISHAIYWAYGLEDADKEERIVGTFGTAWTQVFRDTPELATWLHEQTAIPEKS